MTLRFTPVTFIFFMFFSSFAFAELKNGMDAEVVLGQPDFTTTGTGTSATKFNIGTFVTGIAADNAHLFIPDANNHRVLIYNKIPTSNGAPADVVLGQTDFTAGGSGTSAATFNRPLAVASDGKRLAVCEQLNHRCLIFNKIPTQNGTPADVVIGQIDFASSGSGLAANRLNNPRGVAWVGEKLFISDSSNNRILIFNKTPTTNGASADVVIGQPNFTSNGATDVETGGRSARTLNNPSAPVASDGRKLIVADTNNNRVLIFNSIPTQNYAYADVVIGQPDFIASPANNGGVSARSLQAPEGLVFFGKELFIADQTAAASGGRVLIFKTLPISNLAPADFVLGQPDFISNTLRAVAGNTFGSAEGLAGNGRQLFVPDETNNRILIFNIFSGSAVNLGPQFNQGKAVLGKVFEDPNSNGVQDNGEKGIEGIKVASDTGIYAITDEDGKYHFPYIETGQRILKLDPSTLPEGSTLTTESPRKITVTKGILTKVSFGVKPPLMTIETKPSNTGPLLKVSVSQDPVLLKPILSIEAKPEKDKLVFTIHCNYFLFIQKAELRFYDKDLKSIKTILLPSPLPGRYSVPASELSDARSYQLSVWDKQGREDRTSLGSIQLLPLT